MKKLLLNGNWHMSGGGYSCDGKIPGSVYSFLLENSLMDDPYYRMNELKATEILENDFDFERTFVIDPDGNRILLHCDGLDTICKVYVNGKEVGEGDNMHRTYEFDITDAVVKGENALKIH